LQSFDLCSSFFVVQVKQKHLHPFIRAEPDRAKPFFQNFGVGRFSCTGKTTHNYYLRASIQFLHQTLSPPKYTRQREAGGRMASGFSCRRCSE